MYVPSFSSTVSWSFAARFVGAGLLAFGLLLPCAALAGPPDLRITGGSFDASWNADGTVHLLEFKDSVPVAAGRLTGTLVMQTNQGAFPSFETECIAFSDDTSVGLGRCVWTNTVGDKVFVELQSSGTAGFGPTRGRLVGGTGRFEGISGGFVLEWNYSVSGWEDATLTGHTIRMNGNFQLGRPER